MVNFVIFLNKLDENIKLNLIFCLGPRRYNNTEYQLDLKKNILVNFWKGHKINFVPTKIWTRICSIPTFLPLEWLPNRNGVLKI